MEVLIGMITVCALLVWLNYFWMRHTQELVNKVMSQSYRDFAISEKIQKNEPKPVKAQEFVSEDLGPLGEFKFN